MKKFLFLATVLTMMVSLTGLSQAAPAGDPADPVLLLGTYPIKGEALVDIVFERELDLSNDNAKIEAQWYFAKASVVLIEKVEVYGLLGTAKLKLKDWTASNYDMESDYALAWGGGAKVLLYETEEYGDGILRVSVDGNYRQYEPGIEEVKIAGTEISNVSEKEFEYREWGVGLGLSYTLDQLTPYIGVKYSDCEAKMRLKYGSVDITKKTANSKDVVGIFVGCDYLFAENIALNLEGRFIDETAMNVGVKINF